MIDEVDEALRTLLRDEALDGSEVDVVFDAPTKDWAARRNAPTVNAYLYDIREDMRKRTRGMINEYNDDGIVVARQLPPRFYNLSYLITAWTQRPEDEHRLLAQMLLCFSNYEAMPEERLDGRVRELGLAVEMKISLPPPEDRSFADVWTALGGELKPSIDVVLSVPLTPERRFTVGPPVKDEGPSISLTDLNSDATDHRVPHAASEQVDGGGARGGAAPGAGGGASGRNAGGSRGASGSRGDSVAQGVGEAFAALAGESRGGSSEQGENAADSDLTLKLGRKRRPRKKS